MAGRTNCIAWALALYVRRGCRGYIAIRRSRWGPFPHMLYCEIRRDGRLRCVSFVPSDPKRKRLPPPLFSGRSRWGDM